MEPEAPVPAALALAGGAGQSGVVGSALADSLVVKVTDAKGGAVSGTAVAWAIRSGGGSLSAVSALTDAAGLARVAWTLGTAAGASEVTATVSGLAPVTFTATALPDRPAWVSLSPYLLNFDALGDTVRLSVQVSDRYGNTVAWPTLQWSSSDTAVAHVDSAGLVTSRGRGVAAIEAVADTARRFVSIRVEPDVASLHLAPDTLRFTALGDTARLSASVRDRHGNVIPGATVTWVSRDTTVARVNGSGVVAARANGVTFVVASTGGKADSARVRVVQSGGLSITGVSPATLTPGASATIAGSGFSATASDNLVMVDGVAVTVTAATASQITIALPPRATFGCRPTRDVEVAVTVAGTRATRAHSLALARQIPALNPGDYVNLTTAEEARCIELPEPGIRYVVSVYNTSTSAAAISSFRLRGEGGSAMAAAPAVQFDRRAATATRGPLLERTAQPSRPLQGRPQPVERARREMLAHASLLEKNRDLVARLGSPRKRAVSASADRAPGISAAPAPIAPGTMLSLSIPNINGSNLCTNPVPVRARVVYAGPKAVVLEDSIAPLAGTMDAVYREMAQEFERTMLPVLEHNFGNPLAFDPWIGGGGRILMLFSPAVNDFGGVAGFVTSADFYPPSRCPSSNEAQIFYAVVPTSSAGGYASGTIGGWRRSMRSTIIHEVKHITSNAERFARDWDVLEESWLEESTARVAEELWGRSIFGYNHLRDSGYGHSIYCEVRPEWPECGTPPLVMLKHFDAIYSYMESTATLSPLGRTASSDATFYGSGWLLVRWALDHHAALEADFLRALTQETKLNGVANLLARTGKSFAELLGPWSLSLYWDRPTAPALSHPSWDVYDIFAGLHGDFPTGFTKEYPLNVWQTPFGDFTADVPQLRGGSAALIQLSSARAGKQLLELQGAGGGTPSSTLRVAILRVW
jgi:hypothetical protein